MCMKNVRQKRMYTFLLYVGSKRKSLDLAHLGHCERGLNSNSAGKSGRLLGVHSSTSTKEHLFPNITIFCSTCRLTVSLISLPGIFLVTRLVPTTTPKKYGPTIQAVLPAYQIVDENRLESLSCAKIYITFSMNPTGHVCDVLYSFTYYGSTSMYWVWVWWCVTLEVLVMVFSVPWCGTCDSIR